MLFATFLICCGVGTLATGYGLYAGGKAIYEAVTEE